VADYWGYKVKPSFRFSRNLYNENHQMQREEVQLPLHTNYMVELVLSSVYDE